MHKRRAISVQAVKATPKLANGQNSILHKVDSASHLFQTWDSVLVELSLVAVVRSATVKTGVQGYVDWKHVWTKIVYQHMNLVTVLPQVTTVKSQIN